MKLLEIVKIEHIDINGDVIWEAKKLPNLLHNSGQQFCLQSLFNTASSQVPSYYYFGLDNRTTLSVTDTLANLANEPTQFGYMRQTVSSVNGFAVALNSSNIYQATTGLITFSAVGGSWGPIQNLFITNTNTASGYLISSVALGTSRTVTAGQALNLTMGLTLSDSSCITT